MSLPIRRKSRAYGDTFKGKNGDYVLASLLDFAGFYRSSFSDNPHQTSYNEGKRAVALHLIQILGLTEADIRELVRSYRTEIVNSGSQETQWEHNI